MDAGCCPGKKQPGRGVHHPQPSSAEAKERVDLYLYSLFGHTWPFLGWILPLPLYMHVHNKEIQDSSFSIVTRPQVGQFRFLIPVQAGNFLFSSTFRWALGSNLKGTGVFSRCEMAGAWSLNTHLHLVPMSRMNGAIPLFPVYAFMALTGTSFPLSTANECFFLHTKCSECPELFYMFMNPESLENSGLDHMLMLNLCSIFTFFLIW